MIYLKVNKTEQIEIVAVCDEELIGRKFSENNLSLDITERFYKGEKMENEKIAEKMKKARNLNIVGKNSVKIALENGIIDEENIIKVKNIPHAIVFEV